MAKKISDELKKAIKDLPVVQKDKLLLRLVAKDSLLVEKLQHQLLESAADVEERREALASHIHAHFSSDNMGFWSHSPGLMMMDLRSFSGAVTRHVKITGDKYGEVQLLLLLVNIPFVYQQKILNNNLHRADKFAKYVVQKAQMIFKKLSALDPDYYLEFEQDVNKMLQHLQHYPPTATLMTTYGLPLIWEY